MVGVLAAPRPAVSGRTVSNGSLLWAHLAGLLIGAVPVGAALGGLGQLAGVSRTGAVPLVAFSALAFAYGLHDMRLVRLPHPQRRVQVPNRWRRSGKPLRMAFGYGLGLGPGFLVYIRSGAYFVVLLGVLISGSVALGAAALAAIAIGRAALLAGAQQYRARDGRPGSMLTLMSALDGRVRTASGTMLVGVGTMLVVSTLVGALAI